MDYLLETRGLTKMYSGRAAIQNVDVKVISGEILVILGPSGSGKSTLLKSIAGLIDVSAGQILLRGRDITDIPIQDRNLGLVMQGYSLFPHMTAFENVAYPLRTKAHRTSATDLSGRVTRMFELTGLTGLEERKPLEMSGGQQQRVALARALVFDPDILLLDEPLGALDRELRERMEIEIRQIQRTLRTTVLYITHDQQEALTVADRIAIFRNGSIAQIGAPVDLYQRPTSQFVAEFLGGANLLKVLKTTSVDGKVVVETPVGSFRVHPRSESIDTGPASIMVRPEHLSLYPPADNHNKLKGILVDITFLGNLSRATVTLADETRWCFHLPPEAVDETLTVGRQVEIYWKVNDAQLLAADHLKPAE